MRVADLPKISEKKKTSPKEEVIHVMLERCLHDREPRRVHVFPYILFIPCCYYSLIKIMGKRWKGVWTLMILLTA